MNRKAGFIGALITVAFVSRVLGETVGADGEHSVVTDSRGAPKLVTKGTSLPLVGSFWLHIPIEDGAHAGHEIPLASVDVNGMVKPCTLGLTNLNLNSSTWHFVKWILRKNEFLCVYFNSDHANLTSAPVISTTNATAPENTSYTISPGAGNTDYCVYNFTVGTSVVFDCAHVNRKTAPLADTTACDCPTRPSKTFPSGPAGLDSSNSVVRRKEPGLRGNTVVSTDDQQIQRGNVSHGPTEFPTPKPFMVNGLNESTSTASTVRPTTSAGTSRFTFRLVNVTTTIASTLGRYTSTNSTAATTISTNSTIPQPVSATSTVSTSTPSAISSSSTPTPSCHTIVCKNGGICVQNATQYYCNCTMGFSGEFCERNHSENSSADHRRPSKGCPSDYCQNGGTCRPAVTDVGDDANEVSNFTCYCEEGYVGRRCSYLNVCHWEKPCQNGGYCSMVLPVDLEDQQASAAVNTSFRCQCPRGFTGEQCQQSETTLKPVSTGPGRVKQCNAEESAQCKNGALCTAKNRTVTCSCPANFTGQFCDKPIGGASAESTGSSSKLAAIVGGVLGSIAFIGLIVGSIFFYRCIQRSRKLKGKYNPAREEMTAGGGQTMTMATVTTGERLI